MDAKTIAIALPAGAVIVVASFWAGKQLARRQPLAPAAPTTVVWGPQNRSAGEVIVEATPVELAVGRQPKISLSLDVHSGSLDFDVATVSALIDSQGNTQTAAVWQGDPPGGHHRKGILTFSGNLANKGKVDLVIKEIRDGQGVEFNWVVGEGVRE